MFDWVLNRSLSKMIKNSFLIALNLLRAIFFIPRKNSFCSQNVSIFVFLLNPQTLKSETSLSTLLETTSYTFNCFFRIVGSFKKKFGQILVPSMPSISTLFLYLF